MKLFLLVLLGLAVLYVIFMGWLASRIYWNSENRMRRRLNKENQPFIDIFLRLLLGNVIWLPLVVVCLGRDFIAEVIHLIVAYLRGGEFYKDDNGNIFIIKKNHKSAKKEEKQMKSRDL